MKRLKFLFGLLVTVILFNSCKETLKGCQSVFLNLKNNTEQSIHMYSASGEEGNERSFSSKNLLNPGESRTQELKFWFDSEFEVQMPLAIWVTAGADSLKLRNFSVVITERNDGKDIYRNIQFNSDNSFSSY